MWLFPGKAHRDKEKAAILKSHNQEPFEQNVLQDFQKIGIFLKLWFCLWLIPTGHEVHRHTHTNTHFSSEWFTKKPESNLYQGKVTLRMTAALLVSWGLTLSNHSCWWMWKEGKQGSLSRASGHLLSYPLLWQVTKDGICVCGKLTQQISALKKAARQAKKQTSEQNK